MSTIIQEQNVSAKTNNNALEYAVAAQERTLDALRQSQAAAIESVENWAKAVDNAVPERPAVPVLSNLPTAQELVKNSFDFAEQVLSTQRSFAEDILKATTGLVKTTPVETPAVK